MPPSSMNPGPGSLFHMKRPPPGSSNVAKKKGAKGKKKGKVVEAVPPSPPLDWILNDEEVLPTNKIVEVTSFFVDSMSYFNRHPGRVRRQAMERVQFFCSNQYYQGTEYVSNPHCEIWFENDNYWIRDLQSAKGTFVNGVKLYGSTKLKLVHGDIVSFGISHLDPIFYTDKKMDLAYKFLITNKEKEELVESKQLSSKERQIDQLQEKVFGNNLLLSEILGHLPLRDLKKVRLVNSTWRSGSNKSFYSSSLLQMRSDFVSEFPYFFKHYENYFRQSSFENAKVSLNIQDDDRTPSIQTKGFVTDAMWFLQTYGTRLKTAKLFLDIKQCPVLSYLTKVETLQLSITAPFEFSKTLEVPKIPTMTSVKTLYLKIVDSDDDSDMDDDFPQKFSDLFSQFLCLFPNLESLTVKATFEAATNQCAMKVLKAQPVLLKGLKHFGVKFDDVDNQEVLLNVATLKFPTSLCRLDLDNINNKMQAENIFVVLEHFSPTLEHLGLSVSESCGYQFTVYGHNEDDEDAKKNVIIFPKFGKLKSLRITVANATDDRNRFEFDNGVSRSNICDYGEMFPALRTLKFIRSSFDEGRFPMTLQDNGYLEPFIPSTGNSVCNTVTRLVLPFANYKGKDRIYRKWLQGVAEVFPNVDSLRLSSVRKNEKLLPDDVHPKFNPSDFARKNMAGRTHFHLCITMAVGLNGCTICNPRKRK